MKHNNIFATLSNFPFTQIFLLSEIWLVFLKWDLLVSFFNYKYWQITIDKSNIINQNDTQLPQVLDIIRLSEKVGRHHIRNMNCLRRCLCQKQLLEKRQFSCELHIGVKMADGSLKAHSWLSYHNVLINDSTEVVSQYTELEASSNSKIFSALRG